MVTFVTNHTALRAAMTSQSARLITINIREGTTGLFVATCEDEPGFYLSRVGAEPLWDALPLALEAMFRDKNQDVAATPIENGTFGSRPWAIVQDVNAISVTWP